MNKYYITFGQRSPFKNGWVEIEASSIEEAQKIANDILGKWSMCYIEKEMSFEHFPGGRYGMVIR